MLRWLVAMVMSGSGEIKGSGLEKRIFAWDA
jgi:hypothetical protein